MGALRFVPLAVLAAGVGLIVDAALRGGVSLALVVVVPVLFSDQAEFFLGVLLLFLGFVTLPLTFGYRWASEEALEAAPPAARRAPTSEIGGVVLLGPVPVFFGRWSRPSRRARWAWAAIGLGFVVAFVVLVVLLSR